METRSASRLPPAGQRHAGTAPGPEDEAARSVARWGALAKVVEGIAAARDLETLMAVIRPSIRRLTGADPRIPHDAYRPTFVKSPAMVPVGPPVAAIGCYWARRHHASAEDVAFGSAPTKPSAASPSSPRTSPACGRRRRKSCGSMPTWSAGSPNAPPN